MKKPDSRKKTGKGGRLAVRILLIFLISVILGGTIYSINARRILHNELPMPLGIGSAVVLSGSMEPTLSVNDLVVIRAREAYAPGDIVVFVDRDQAGGTRLTIHRILELNGDTCVTKGDANNTADDPVSLSDVKGSLLFKIPKIGNVIHFLQSTPGKLLLILLAAVLLVRSWSSERRADEEEREKIKAEIRRLRAEQLGETGKDSPPKP